MYGGVAFAVTFIASITLFNSDLSRTLFASDLSTGLRTLEDIILQNFPNDGQHANWLPYFPDILVYMLARLFQPAHFTSAAYFFIIGLLQAIGWMLICQKLGAGKMLIAAPLFLQALLFLLMGYSGSDMLLFPLLPFHHGGAWTAIPYLFLAVLNFHLLRARILFFVLILGVAASDAIITAWFIAPCIAVLAILWRYHGLSARFCLIVSALAIAAFISGNVVGKLVTSSIFYTEGITVFNPSLALIPKHLKNMAHGIAQYPHLAVVHLFFSLILLRIFWQVIRPMLATRHGKNSEIYEINKRDNLTQDGDAAIFCTLFLPAMMAAAFCGQMLLTTLDLGNTDSGYTIPFHAFRYSIPFIYLPLFLGWALLPLLAKKMEFSQLNITPMWFNKTIMQILPNQQTEKNGQNKIALTAAAILVTAAAPLIAKLPEQTLSPFNTPYMNCVREYANELGWTGGIGKYHWWESAILADDIPITRQMPVEFALLKKQPVMGIMWDNYNRHQLSGEFQVVAVNLYQNGLFTHPPRSEADFCTDNSKCKVGTRDLSEKWAKAIFGEPAKIVTCEGVALWHYDPPLQFDFSKYTTRKVYPRFIFDGKLQ